MAVNFPIDALLVPPKVALFHWDPVALFLLEEVLELLRPGYLGHASRCNHVWYSMKMSLLRIYFNPLLREFNGDAMLKPSSNLGMHPRHLRIRVEWWRIHMITGTEKFIFYN